MVFLLKFFHALNDTFNLAEQDLADLTDRRSQNGDHWIGVKATDQSKIIRGEYRLRVKAAACQSHKGNALVNEGAELPDKGEVSVLQRAAGHDLLELRYIFCGALSGKV